ncbi:MAG: amino acid adenylation domain-containing protein [Anaerolineae bacterium]|nr:amino acid adenylation domain-containing protein [Anaerolineae bacterium]
MIYLLPQAVDQSADKYPDHEAMRFNGQGITYAELARRTDKLARLLSVQGVRKGDRVGIYLNKSLESAVAIYGIMKAGAAYVPLDPLAPISRLKLVIEDCGIRHIVSHPPKAKSIQELISECPGLECVVGLALTETSVRSVTWEAVNSLPSGSAPALNLMEHDLAYIMYTSGSTGKPKGMMHTHYSGLSYAKMAADVYGVTHQDRLSNHSPLHFDMSTFDYFSGPLCGATTIIIPEAYTKLPASLSKLVQDERMTIWYSVPFALIQMLLNGVMAERDWSALRWVLFGGEPFTPKHLRALMQRLPQTRFSNVYGPAEVNQCTFYHVPPQPEDKDEQVPIGRVWANSEGLVVDENDQPVQPGEVGELLVRTPTMMRGYWGRPDLTERGFYRRKTLGYLEDIFYRTGDLVQELPDGELLFLGRKDRQVKIRGYRVELDEVETALSRHPQVDENATYALPLADGNAVIEAVVILKPGAAVTAMELKGHLATHLPPYAVPEKILLMSDFPRTTSGKIDRRALKEQALVALDGAGG